MKYKMSEKAIVEKALKQNVKITFMGIGNCLSILEWPDGFKWVQPTALTVARLSCDLDLYTCTPLK